MILSSGCLKPLLIISDITCLTTHCQTQSSLTSVCPYLSLLCLILLVKNFIRSMRTLLFLRRLPCLDKNQIKSQIKKIEIFLFETIKQMCFVLMVFDDHAMQCMVGIVAHCGSVWLTVAHCGSSRLDDVINNKVTQIRFYTS